MMILCDQPSSHTDPYLLQSISLWVHNMQSSMPKQEEKGNQMILGLHTHTHIHARVLSTHFPQQNHNNVSLTILEAGDSSNLLIHGAHRVTIIAALVQGIFVSMTPKVADARPHLVHTNHIAPAPGKGRTSTHKNKKQVSKMKLWNITEQNY